MAVRDTTKTDYKAEPAIQRDRGRSEDQKDIDSRTEALVTQWDTASQPGLTDGKYTGPVVRFDVDDKAEGKRMVARAFTLISKHRREHQDNGKTVPLLPSNLRAYWYKDSQPDNDGFVTIQYGVAVQIAQNSPGTPASQETSSEDQEKPSEDQEKPDEDQEKPDEDQERSRGFRRR